MKRVERLRIFGRAIADIEHQRAQVLEASERHLSACTTRLTELETYYRAYSRQFNASLQAVSGSADFHDYSAFLARLSEAVRQQTWLVTRARTERDAERLNWRDAAQRAEVVGRLIGRWKNEDSGLLSLCRQQHYFDRARRSAPRKRVVHGPQ